MSAAEKSTKTFMVCGVAHEYDALIIGMEWSKPMSNDERGKWLQEKLDIGSVWRRGHKGEDRKAEPPPQKPANNNKPDDEKVIDYDTEKARREQRTGQQSPVQAAMSYVKGGYHTIPLKRDKTPMWKEWQERALTEGEVMSMYGGETQPNIGWVLGDGSQRICDYDMDWQEARLLAPIFWPQISAYSPFGRKGKLVGHFLFQCAGVNGRIKQFKLPESFPASLKAKFPDAHKMVILEVRGNGQYTMVPPGRHENGDEVVWIDSEQFVMPPERPWADMVQLGGLQAFCSLMIKLYPSEGHRNAFTLALSGVFVRALAPAYKDDDDGLIKAADMLNQAVYKLAGDRGHGKSWENRAANSLALFKAGKPFAQLGDVCKILGIDDPATDRTFRSWLYGSDADDDRPVIKYEDGDQNSMLQCAQTAIIGADMPIYQRGGKLVKPLRLAAAQESGGIKRAAGSMLISPITPLSMRVYMTTAARWRVPAGGKGNNYRWGAPPKDFAQTMLEHRDIWEYPSLSGIVETPAMREDGSIIAVEGYDVGSGLLVDFGGVVYPTIPESPTRAEALDALAKIKWLIKDFAFVKEEIDGVEVSPSLSVALSLMLTAVIRKVLRTAPLHLIDAEEAGEGKTLLVDTAAYIATGREAALTTWANPEELEKRLVSHFMAGDPLINFDNITTPIGSEMFDAILTHASFKPRLLGGNNAPLIPTNSTMAATGNNARVKGDTSRRTIKARLNSGHATPWTRQEHEVKDLPAHILSRRPELVAAVLTFLRGFIASGAAVDDSLILGSFEDWSRRVRAPLIWAGEPDPILTQAALLADNPTRTIQRALGMAWRDCSELADDWKRVEQIMGAGARIENQALGAALGELCPLGLNSRALGHKLQEMIDKPLTLPTADGNSSEVYRLRKLTKLGYSVYRLELDPAQTTMLV